MSPRQSNPDNFQPPIISLMLSGGFAYATYQLYTAGQAGWEYGTVGSFVTGGLALGQLFKALNNQAKLKRAARKRKKLRKKAREHSQARFAKLADIKACNFLSAEEGVFCGTIRTAWFFKRDVYCCTEGSLSVIAPPGQGKTTTIVIGTILNYAERHRRGLSSENLIIHDPSSEVLSVTIGALECAGYKVYVLTPYPDKVERLTGLKPTFAQLDIFSWCTDDFPSGELRPQLMHTMVWLVPIDPNNTDAESQYFMEDARHLGVFLALTLIVRGEKPSLPGIRKLFVGDLHQLVVDAMDSDALDGLYAEAAAALNFLLRGSSPQFTGGYGVFRQCIDAYDDYSTLGAFTLGHEGFNPSRLKHPTERTALFVISTLDKMKTLAPTTALALNYLFDSIAADPQNGKCLAILDEISAVAWPELTSSLEYYRKANLRAVLIWQDLQGQTERRLGKAAVKQLLSVSQVLIGMGLMEIETLELFAKHCGQKALIDYSTNNRAGLRDSPDVTHGEQVKTASLFAVDAIRTMGSDQLLVIGGNLPPLKLDKLYYWDRSAWRAIAGKNPFYEG